ncbi:MAG: RimK family alpha-L-glutamate ligase [Clostridia bacterium]|nr:RimK family alpha-L-glutamate ligase [Clostridia bacterium]
MQGLVLINGYPNGEKFYRQGERIAEELRALGVQADVLRNGEVYATLFADGKISSSVAQKYNFAVYLDKDKYLGRMLEGLGLRLFNPISAIELCDDKMLTYLALREANVPLIKSVPAPLCYTPNVKANEFFLQKVSQELGFPLVVKKSYGSFGAGVQLVHGMPDLIKAGNEFLHEPHFFQQFISEAAGRDIRVIVIGGKAVAAMERVAKTGEFRSNIELGGEGRTIALSETVASVAEKAARALGLDYCGVDVLQTQDGARICEVNSNAFFEGLEATTGINVARLYAEYISNIFKF